MRLWTGAWIAAWASVAACDGVERGAGYWDAAYRWIVKHQDTVQRPMRSALGD